APPGPTHPAAAPAPRRPAPSAPTAPGRRSAATPRPAPAVGPACRGPHTPDSATGETTRAGPAPALGGEGPPAWARNRTARPPGTGRTANPQDASASRASGAGSC